MRPEFTFLYLLELGTGSRKGLRSRGATFQTFVIGRDGRLRAMWTGAFTGDNEKSVGTYFKISPSGISSDTLERDAYATVTQELSAHFASYFGRSFVFSQVPLAFDVASIKAAVTSPDGSYVLGRSRETPGGVDYRSISLYRPHTKGLPGSSPISFLCAGAG